MEETLTRMRPGPTESLERALSSTKPIRNLGRVREMRCWRDGAMIQRWTAADALEAVRGFRTVVGYTRVIRALEARRRATRSSCCNRSRPRVDNRNA